MKPMNALTITVTQGDINVCRSYHPENPLRRAIERATARAGFACRAAHRTYALVGPEGALLGDPGLVCPPRPGAPLFRADRREWRMAGAIAGPHPRPLSQVWERGASMSPPSPKFGRRGAIFLSAPRSSTA